jgi:organic hydroperoxide reductase OsmC/OhrA
VGTVERVERVTRFTEVTVRAALQVPDGTDETKARRVLEKTEQSCLISNSLRAAVHLVAEVRTVRTAA